MIDILNSIDVRIQTGLIAALATIIGILLKDLGLKVLFEKKAEKQLALNVYRNYADPISSSTTSLFWRLNEIITQEGRGSFLKSGGEDTPFEKYKYDSTLYRIAAQIGWLRAYSRELTMFSLQGTSNLRNAIKKFEAALADGMHIEQQRVQSVSAIWGINNKASKIELTVPIVEINSILQKALHNESKSVAADITEKAQLNLCREIAKLLTDHLSINSLPENIIQETQKRVIQLLSIKEAWIYRDFQTGIGDMMIKKSDGGSRQFEIIGFREFEALLLASDDESKRWIARLETIIKNLDISGADIFDARLRLLEETLLATTKLLRELNYIDPKRAIVTSDTLKRVHFLLGDQSWRKTEPPGPI